MPAVVRATYQEGPALELTPEEIEDENRERWVDEWTDVVIR